MSLVILWELAGFLSWLTGINPTSSSICSTFNQFAIYIHYVCPPFWVMKNWKAIANRKSLADCKWCNKSVRAINWSIVLVSTCKVIKAERLEGTRVCLAHRSPRTLGSPQCLVPKERQQHPKAFIPMHSIRLLSTYCVSGIMPNVENTAEKKRNEVFNMESSILVGRGK